MADERFKSVQTQYAMLKAQLDSGRMTREQFEAALRPLMFQDAQGHYWMIGVDSGRWHIYDGSRWVPSDPPDSDLTTSAGTAPLAPAGVATAAASPAPPKRLVVLRGIANMPSIELTNDSVTVGRATSNNLVLNDLQASRQHARVDFENGAWSVRDLNSRNGTFVNGQRVTLQALRPGDQITIGETLLSVEA